MTLLALALLALGAGSQSYVLRGGQVWRDGRFVAETLYVEDGQFVRSRPRAEPVEIELEGQFVVPPYGDAHTHHFTREESAAASRELFLSRGFFYTANLCGPHGAREATASHTNRPSGVDVLFAHGAITGLTSHPVPLYRALHGRRGLPEETFLELNDDNTFYRVDSLATLETKLDLLLGTRPDLVKFMLTDLAGRAPGGTDALDPDLVAPLVERAHAAGLRAVAHVDTAAEFRHVVNAGVDWLAHTPGYGRRTGELLEPYALTVEDAALAARAGAVVITTAGAYDAARDNNTPAQEAVDHNLALLFEAGATVAFGSDDWNGMETEIEALLTHVGLSPTALLRLLCETTPGVLFPERDLGRLVPGHEASLLVLAGDPRRDPANLGRITLRIKQGVALDGER